MAESREQTGTSRVWRGVEALGVLIAFAAIGTVFTMRDDVKRFGWFKAGADLLHIDHETRIKHLERPELIIQIAQATDAVGDVEETAKLAAANAAAIGVVQVEQRHQRDDLARQEGYMLQVLERLNVQPDPSRAPAPRSSEVN